MCCDVFSEVIVENRSALKRAKSSMAAAVVDGAVSKAYASATDSERDRLFQRIQVGARQISRPTDAKVPAETFAPRRSSCARRELVRIPQSLRERARRAHN
jgi:hypothetical protein